jgi:aryl-alcohol dehydrogenase-like predicted oxidoreductase
MEYRKLGSSDLEVSAFALGSWLTYEFMAEDDALTVLKSGLDRGITFLDDARYDDRTGHAPLKSGYSEVLFGQLLRRSGANRYDLVIGNKLWLEFYPGQGLEEEIDGSLQRMKLDYIDLAYCAPPPANVPLFELLRQLDALVRTGKVRYWGTLNWSGDQLSQAHDLATREGLHRPVASQPAYSLLAKSPVEDPPTARAYRDNGIGIVASYTLYGGLLSGKYNRDSAALNNRFKPAELEKLREKGLLAKVERVIEIAGAVGCTPAQLALAYVLKNPLVGSILFGAKNPAQIDDNLQALEVAARLDETVMAQLHDL